MQVYTLTTMQLMTIITLWLVIAFSYGNYLESNFEFLGHVPTPVSADSASKEVTISHCFSSCIQNNNCYFIDFCDNSISETCYMYERNRTNVIGADGGPCRRYKLRQMCEGEFTQPCRCPEHRGGERCKYKYDCSGNLVHPATSSYTFRRAFSNDYTHELYCDMVTEGGGWIVFQKRMDGSVDFYRNWNDYTNGFGNLNEYYKGNNALFEIVKDGNFELRIDLEDKSGEWRYAKYFHFSIGGPDTNFTLSVSGYTGNAGDSLGPHNGQQFTTYMYDRDNDIHPIQGLNCAEFCQGAWWYHACSDSNLNGEYGNDVYAKGLNWLILHDHYYSLISSRMMVRIKRT